MKTRQPLQPFVAGLGKALLVLLVTALTSLVAQTASPDPSKPAAQVAAVDPSKPAVRVRKEPVKTEPQVVERGQHHARVEWFLEEEGPDGKIFRQPRGYTRLETGLHYWDAASKAWKETQELIKPTAGGAVADEGPQKVTFSLNVNEGEGSVSIVTPDGQKLRGGVLALAYFDTATQKQVVLALAKDAKGKIVGQNQVIYQDAFEGVNADVLYTYTKAGLMQEVIFRRQPPSPAKVELTPETTLLQVLTEWSELPVLKERVAVSLNQKNSGALSDEKLDFGSVQIGSGKAFWKEGATRKGATPVGKKLVEENGRKILFESVPYLELEESLKGLPDSGWVRVETPKDSSGRVARRSPDGLYAGGGAMSSVDLVASVATKGVSVDWTVLGSVTNLVLQGDMTYDVAGLVEVENLVVEGGTVVKFEDYTSSQILVTRSIDCQTDSYRPAVFTSVYDGGVGEKIYLGTLARDYAAGGALKVDLTYVTGPIELKNLRFSWAMTGIAISDGGLNTNETQILRNVQFVNCGTGLEIDNAKVGFFNGLVVSDKGTNTTAFDVTGGSLRGEHLTLHKLATLSVGTGSNEVVNTLAVDLSSNPGTLGAGSQNLWNINGSLVFTNVVFGSHYLPTNSAYLNAGSTNGLDFGLAQSLKLKTTQAPVLYSNYTFSAVTTLGPTVARDTNTPDVGFHYDPLDYAFAQCTVSTSLTFTAGTAVGFYYSAVGYSPSALTLADRQTVAFNGTAENRCYFVRTTLSQEGSPGTFSYSSGGVFATGTQYSYDASLSPHLWATFTVFGGLARYDNPYGEYYGYLTVHLTHSEVWNMTAASYILSQHLTNCFLGRTYGGQVYGWTGTAFTFQNGTMRGGYLDLSRYGAAVPFVVRDVAFDGTLVSEADSFGGTSIDYSFNAYTNSGDAYRLNPTNANDKIVTSFNWQAGPLGNYYLPANSPLLNVGSTSATNVGLYYFTVLTNQQREASSTVDIGYHYIAVDGNGKAIDTDGDGIPDYLDPDADNDGLTDLEELQMGTDPVKWDTDGDGLSDAEELVIPLDASNLSLGFLDPLDPDTGSTGKPDCDKDSDHDGITNLGELADYGSDPADAHTFSATNDDARYLFTAEAGASSTLSLAVLSPPNNLGGGKVRFTVDSYANAKYDLYFVPDLLAPNWQWRRVVSGITCSSAGQAVFTIKQPDPYQGYFQLFDANDTDADGLSDGYEAWFKYSGKKTTMNLKDSDGDLITDGWEVAYGLNPMDNTGANGGGGDPDADLATNLAEYSNNLTFNTPTHDPRKRNGVEAPRPVVSISSSDPNADGPQGTATFTITRSIGTGGSLANALTVYYSVGGEADYLVDYTLSPAPDGWPRIFAVDIPASQASVTVTLTSSTVTLAGLGSRKVVVKLTPYAVSPTTPVSDPLQWPYVVNLFKEAVTLGLYNQLPALNGPVYAVKMYQTSISGSGNTCSEFHQLIVGGQFTMAGSTPVNNIARWNASSGSWEALGTGVNGPVYAIETVADAAGDTTPDIYVGGAFSAPGVGITKWNGNSGTWSALGSGLSSSGFGAFDYGIRRANVIRKIGDTLWVGGRFSSAGGVASPNLAKWNLTTAQWQTLGGTIINCNGTSVSGFGINHLTLMVTSMTPDGTAIGLADIGVSAVWLPVGITSENYFNIESAGTVLRGRCHIRDVRAVLGSIAGHDPYSTSPFSPAGNAALNGGISLLGSSGWELLGHNGPAFAPVGFPWMPYLVADGSGWNTPGAVNSLASFGGDIYLGGSFGSLKGAYPNQNVADYSPFNNIMKWNPSSGWSKLQNGSGFPCIEANALGVNGPIYAMDVEYSLCNGAFQGLWVGGNFTKAGGGSAWSVAFWKAAGHWDVPATPTLTSPANNDYFLPSATVTLTAGFAASGCTLAGVEFYEGTTRLAASTTAPYTFNWTTAPIGTHTVTAVSTDSNGKVGVSDPVTFRVDAPPTVSVTSPAGGAIYTGPVNITINATAGDTDGTVSQVEFFVNGSSIGADTAAPFSKVWSNVTTGNYTITAKATDNNGAVTTSAGISIHVN